jgi:hypothetical protein
MEKELFVICSDLLDVDKVDVEKNISILSMYCEMGSKTIDPDAPPTFWLQIKRENDKISLSPITDDLTEEEKSLFKDEIIVFINEIQKDFDDGTIEIPPIEELKNEFELSKYPTIDIDVTKFLSRYFG